MRYQNWDVLMFPNELCKIPLQEFKTSCQVVQDPEVHHSQSTALLLPTVTCFVPSLPAGEPFRISIHSWQNPEASRYIHQISSRHAEHVLFEARVFVDGRIAGTKLFHRNGPWPTVLETSVGRLQKLEFPTFHRELLSQSYWNPGDDLGRVKVVVSEGVPRDNLSMPFERIKNLVAFSFQHAPLDVLEASSIAWPNATMWRQVSLVAPFYNQHSSPKRVEEDREAHAHSPRKPPAVEFMSSQTNSMPPPPPPFSKPPNFDPFTSEPTRPSFSGWRRQGTSTDTSMPDLPSNSSEQAGSTRNVSDPMIIEKAFRNNDMQSTGAYESLCEALLPPVPDNTPQNGSEVTLANTIALRQPSMQRGPSRPCLDRVETPRALGAPDTPEGLVSQIEEARFLYSRRLSSSSLSCAKSNKENGSRSPGGQSEILGPNNQRNASGSSTRRSSHLFTSTNVMGTKRQRNVTPASSKAIDDEDEPRSSPSLRKASRQLNASGHSRGKDSERKVLSAVDNV